VAVSVAVRALSLLSVVRAGILPLRQPEPSAQHVRKAGLLDMASLLSLLWCLTVGGIKIVSI
jgi:hypothetical protein